MSKIIKYIFITACFLVLNFLLIQSTLNESPTYDEIGHVKVGYGFLTAHDFRVDPFSPPFSRELVAIPMLFNQNIILDPVLLYPRLIVILFTNCLALVIYFFAKKIYGSGSALFALLLFIFEPDLLAHGHYATTDLISTFFLTLSLFIFFLFHRDFTPLKIIIFAAVVGLTLSTKFTTLSFLFASLAVFYFLNTNPKKQIFKLTFWRKRLISLLIFFLTLSAFLWSTYFFTFEPALGYRFDPNRPAIQMAKNNPLIHFALTQPIPLGGYTGLVKEAIRYNYSRDFIKESFFFGTFSPYGLYGFLLLPALLIKTPLPLLIILILTFLFTPKTDLKKSRIIIIPIVLILASGLFSHVLLVIRYILPLFPLIIIFSSNLTNLRFPHKPFLLISLIIWYALSVLSSYPHFISYFNEIAGGPKQGYKYLVDANLDWGQGLLDLAKYQKSRNIQNLQLAYFGTADPNRYGIRYQRLADRSFTDRKPQKQINPSDTIAISASCWYFCGYYRNPLLKNKKPVDIVGGSILIFK